MSDNTKDTSVQEFIRVIFADWFSGMSGGLSIPFVALGAFNVGNQKDLFYSLAIISLGVTAWRLWSKGRKRINELEDKIKKPPKTKFEAFKIFLDKKISDAEKLTQEKKLSKTNIVDWYNKLVAGVALATTYKIGWADGASPIEDYLYAMHSKMEVIAGSDEPLPYGQLEISFNQCIEFLKNVRKFCHPTEIKEYEFADLEGFY